MDKVKNIVWLLCLVIPILVWGAEREVTVVNGEVTLAGTLLMPETGMAKGAPVKGASVKGAVVMVTGSGAQNRDEELMGHKPFRTIAEYLASRGYATLRLDDRGVGGSTGDFSKATADDFVSDTQAAIAFVNNELPGVPVGVLGHSEGGSVGIRTASDSTGAVKPEFLITIGAPAWQGDSIIMSQARAMAVALQGSWPQEGMQRNYLNIAMSKTPAFKARLALQMAFRNDMGAQVDMPQVKQILDQQIDALLSNGYRQMLRYNPAEDIRAVQVPWLAVNGELDMQVLPGNLQTIKELNPKAETLLLPGHNHLLQKAKTGLPTEYGQIPEDISPEALQAIGDWLDTNLNRF